MSNGNALGGDERDRVLFVRLNAFEQALVRRTAARRHQGIAELIRAIIREAAAASGVREDA